ncbi:transmembrane protein, putative (macronuclear) [Tetrahymena thermophila SB210]|uniref:Transmembrane protein, putative n=1 Tax=Tetrahymena thermophila (strain SB210) TaxID=312017 RepID=I7LU36_TETTS|nr:transmembrane protein, putative [Tetrahymena thermophila SB210]EAR89346.2 transmembrane protein, putative [Tetrahymena thermophila SB210]|eukprot:XP_001009591.2 transmembrane protein, putative [Tetrahymena thermophila SB210]
MVLISELQSGGNIILNIKLLDSENKIFSINVDKYIANNYPSLIQDELSQYLIEISQSTQNQSLQSQNNQIAQIKGQSLISAKQFNYTTNSFSFQTLSLSYIPLQSTDSLALKLTISNQYQSMLIPLNLQFRKCIRGEIPIKQFNSVVICQECLPGTYSLLIPDYNSSNIDIQDYECKKCPQFSVSCSQDQIILEAGYWRINQQSDQIIACNQQYPDICNEADQLSKFGCIQGYMGPLCETCDYLGIVWKNKRYTNSFESYKCNECSQQEYQILFVILAFTLFLLYFLFSIIMFMNSYIHNSTCYYMRLFGFVPFSRSSINDESIFYIKKLVNYLQLSSVLFANQIHFILPSVFNILPQVAGMPVSQLIISFSCIYSMEMIQMYGIERIRAISQSIVPIIFLLSLALVLCILKSLKFLKVNKYHKYIMINFLFCFFQPDNIRFFTEAITCRTIGLQKYQTINLLLSCDDKSYQKFKYSIILPNLLFWILFPVVIFYYMFRYHIRKNKMDYCTTKFKYGYFYLEFKKKYCYWEFIFIYYKTLIVIIVTMFNQLNLVMYLICVVIIFIYILLVQMADPFQSKNLLKLEIFSQLNIIFNIVLSQIYANYQFILLQIIICFLHYGLIFYLICFVIKLKFYSLNSCLGRLVKKIILIFISKLAQRNQIPIQQKQMKILMLWKKIKKSLAQIRAQKIQQQMIQISTMANKSNIHLINQKKESSQTEIPLNFQNISQLDNFSVQPNTKFEDTPQNIYKSKFYFKQSKERETLSNTSSLKDSDKDYILDENSKVSQIGYQKKFQFSLVNPDRVLNNMSISPFIISKAQPIVNQEIFFVQNQNQIEQSQCSDIADDIFQFDENRPVQVLNNTKAFDKNKLKINNISNSDFDKQV